MPLIAGAMLECSFNAYDAAHAQQIPGDKLTATMLN